MSEFATLAAPDVSRTLEGAISAATEALVSMQRDDGHWVFELEADATIPAEYVLMRHYLGEPVDAPLEFGIGKYLRRIQGGHGGWPLFHDGAFDMSASVKAYFALKMIGDDIGSPHMTRARKAILERGGAAQSNVFTRALLALFGIVSWKAVPVMPVEIMLLPRWFPFHLNKISYWARTVIAPLLVLGALKPLARNPLKIGVDELFAKPPQTTGMLQRAPHQDALWFQFFRSIDAILRVVDPYFPARSRKRAIDAALSFVTVRLNGEEGLGAIFPAMVNAVLMFDALGFSPEHPDYAAARKAIDKLLMPKNGEVYCQPCVSPVWDTALACHALLETGTPPAMKAADAGLKWLRPLQVLDFVGDWGAQRPKVRPGGWAFQYDNVYYPDLDDTAVIVMAMERAQRATGQIVFDEAITRGREWVQGLQSDDGGWGAFDANNNHTYLNNIPFSDHGALLDPPTDDVTSRCVSMLSQMDGARISDSQRRGLEFLRRTQREDGAWYGRWGMNYVYGTWSALCALNIAGLDQGAPEVARAAAWLASIQNDDGGWGEAGESYALSYREHHAAPSTASQTSWALLGLMAAGATHEECVAKAICYLLRTQNCGGLWDEERFTATGFPRVFYLRYHGYAKYFPLWALARYRNLKAGASVAFGM